MQGFPFIFAWLIDLSVALLGRTNLEVSKNLQKTNVDANMLHILPP
jgi:hypothetical protein